MGTTLTGTTPQDTYDSLIKVTDNGPLSGTAKYLSDGLGNDSKLALSTGNIGIGTATPAYNLHVNAATDSRIIITDSAQGSTANDGTYIRQSGVNSSIVNQENGTLQFGTNNSFAQTILANGNVGIGTTTPSNFNDVTLGDSILDVNGVIQARGDATNGVAIIQLGGSTYRKVSLYSPVGTDVGYLGVSLASNGSSSVGTEVARFTPNGLTFNGDTAAANALDDYEEGTWTMGLAFGGASTGITYRVESGATYTKIGRQVTATGFIELTNKGSATGIATITGLPFAVNGSGWGFFGAAACRLTGVSFSGQYALRNDIGGTTLIVQQTTEAGVSSILDNTNFVNDSTVMITLTYFV
jgi:hypothetical protein